MRTVQQLAGRLTSSCHPQLTATCHDRPSIDCRLSHHPPMLLCRLVDWELPQQPPERVQSLAEQDMTLRGRPGQPADTITPKL